MSDMPQASITSFIVSYTCVPLSIKKKSFYIRFTGVTEKMCFQCGLFIPLE